MLLTSNNLREGVMFSRIFYWFCRKSGGGEDEECTGGRVRERSVCMCVVLIEKEKERRTRVKVTGQREKSGSGLCHG